MASCLREDLRRPHRRLLDEEPALADDVSSRLESRPCTLCGHVTPTTRYLTYNQPSEQDADARRRRRVSTADESVPICAHSKITLGHDASCPAALRASAYRAW